MNSTLALTPFLTLIEARLGLRIPAKDHMLLRQQLAERMQVHHCPDGSQYAQILGRRDRTAEQEWSTLATQLTNVESYFFRDQGQFRLLRDRLLPALIAQNQSLKRLHLWSAGCSNGAEAYSLAILLAQLLPDRPQWDCRIWGTDINPTVLAQAKRGVYSAWSLRGLDATIVADYFHPDPQGYRLVPHLRQGVQFEPFNLAQGQPWLRAPLDLILCRNVFIYFVPGAIAQALQTFSQALRPGGYLLTGHAELYNQTLSGLTPQLFPESLVYQRQSLAPAQTPPSPTRSPTPRVPVPFRALISPPASSPMLDTQTLNPRILKPKTLKPKQFPAIAPPIAPPQRTTAPNETNPHLQQIHVAFEQKNYPDARHHLQQVLTADPAHFTAHYLQAQLEANLGNHALAQQWCEAALKLQPFSIAIYYLLAHIATETGHTEEAKRWLKKVIYLEPEAIAAYYELRLIYQQQNQPQRVQKLDAIILKFLNRLSPDAYLATPLNMTASQLRALLS
ncbi:MAG: CheR family methyltransferase [Cyanobacteria bacterium P01_G01_bin.54]